VRTPSRRLGGRFRRPKCHPGRRRRLTWLRFPLPATPSCGSRTLGHTLGQGNGVDLAAHLHFSPTYGDESAAISKPSSFGLHARRQRMPHGRNGTRQVRTGFEFGYEKGRGPQFHREYGNFFSASPQFAIRPGCEDGKKSVAITYGLTAELLGGHSGHGPRSGRRP